MKICRTQRGSIYMMVMSTVVIVVTLSLTGMALVRVQQKSAGVTRDMMDARSDAIAGIQYMSSWIEADSKWRQTADTLAGDICKVPLGRSTVHLTMADPIDAAFSNTDTDNIQVTSSASIGSVTQVYRATLTPTQVPLSCLGVGTSVSGNVTLTSATVMGTDQLRSNLNITAATSRVWIPAVASGAAAGLTFNSGATSLATALQFPASTAFDYYKTNGTQITTAGMSGRRIENVLFSPQNNPYGSRATNTKGIYWLDCNGDDFTIQNCRIVGTLVLLNCTGATVIGGGVSWEPADPSLPALLVQGKISFTGSAAPADEGAIGVNLNPVGTPYGGVANAHMKDFIPAKIQGLVYVSGQVVVSGECVIDGQLIVGGRLAVTNSLTVFYNDRYYYNPPPGFRASTVMTLVPGSFVQVVQ